jgi:hypothetical protein
MNQKKFFFKFTMVRKEIFAFRHKEADDL